MESLLDPPRCRAKKLARRARAPARSASESFPSAFSDCVCVCVFGLRPNLPGSCFLLWSFLSLGYTNCTHVIDPEVKLKTKLLSSFVGSACRVCVYVSVRCIRLSQNRPMVLLVRIHGGSSFQLLFSSSSSLKDEKTCEGGFSESPGYPRADRQTAGQNGTTTPLSPSGV